MTIKEKQQVDFSLLYKRISKIYNSLPLGYSQINYLTRVIEECRIIEEYRFLYEAKIIEGKRFDIIMKRLIKRFNSIINNKNNSLRDEEGSSNIKNKLEEKNRLFFRNNLKLLRHLNVAFINKDSIELIDDAVDNIQRGIKKIKIISSISDIVRIIETAREAQIIAFDTETKQITNAFFIERPTKSSLEMKYNTDNSRILKGSKPLRTKKLLSYVKLFCKKSFIGNESALDELIEYMETLKEKV